MGESVRVHFKLDQDDDGYPPVAVETVWAAPTGVANEYVLDNVPFFVPVATIGDTVRVQFMDGNLWFQSVARRSSHSLVRLVFFDRNAVRRVVEHLQLMGCGVEFLSEHSLLAVDIPVTVNLSDVQNYVRSEAETGTLDYEEPILRHRE